MNKKIKKILELIVKYSLIVLLIITLVLIARG